MQASEKVVENLGKAMVYVKKLPPETFFYFDWAGDLRIEASTQADVKAIRSCFRGIIWKKYFDEHCQQWRYTATTRTGVSVTITGVKEGPAQCKMVEETVMEERSVPAEPTVYIKKMVEVKKIRYICPDGDKANGS